MSTLKADTIVAADGTSPVTLTKQSAAKAWVKFNGSTVTIVDDVNVASITDNGTGDFTINMSSSFATANYCVSSTNGKIANNSGIWSVAENSAASPTTSAYRLNVQSPSGTQNDNTSIKNTFHGDLA